MEFKYEYDFQVWCAEWLDKNLAPWARYSHMPASGASDRRRGAMLKKMGLKPGWHDLFIISKPPKAKRYELIEIELKVKTGRLSQVQKEIHEWLDNIGVPSYTVFDTSQFLDIMYAHNLTETPRR